MKRFLLTLCFLIVVCATPSMFGTDGSGGSVITPVSPPQGPTGGSLQWFTNYSQAVRVAQQSKKPLLLFFTGSDWCGWCKKMMQEVFSSPDFAQAVGNSFVFVDVDFPMNKQLPQDQANQNNELKRRFGVTGYPTVIILDSNENFLAETGYRPGGGKAYASYLQQLLQ